MADQPKRKHKAQIQRSTKTGKLRPEDAKKAETVDCPNLKQAGHGKSCTLCHGDNVIKAIKLCAPGTRARKSGTATSAVAGTATATMTSTC